MYSAFEEFTIVMSTEREVIDGFLFAALRSER